ncbi:hypothetical protein Mapa_013269 [Marchantia paleacea]|nr:hypothetical protein Mapa_013269 [Marchantia paleacea]
MMAVDIDGGLNWWARRTTSEVLLVLGFLTILSNVVNGDTITYGVRVRNLMPYYFKAENCGWPESGILNPSHAKFFYPGQSGTTCTFKRYINGMYQCGTDVFLENEAFWDANNQEYSISVELYGIYGPPDAVPLVATWPC